MSSTSSPLALFAALRPAAAVLLAWLALVAGCGNDAPWGCCVSTMTMRVQGRGPALRCLDSTTHECSVRGWRGALPPARRRLRAA